MELTDFRKPVGRAKISADTKEKLGQSGINLLLRNLWPVDCQTCNETLGGGKPSLVVNEWPGWFEASLHHQDCRGPEWNDSRMILDTEDTATYVHMGLSLEATVPGEPNLPLVVINPSMERVSFRPDGNGWRLLYEGRHGFSSIAEVSWDIRTINRDALLVMHEECPGHTHMVVALGGDPRWMVDVPNVIAEHVRAFGGALVMLTHSLNPALWGDDTYDKDTVSNLVASNEGEAVFCGLAKVTLEPLCQQEA